MCEWPSGFDLYLQVFIPALIIPYASSSYIAARSDFFASFAFSVFFPFFLFRLVFFFLPRRFSFSLLSFADRREENDRSVE